MAAETAEVVAVDVLVRLDDFDGRTKQSANAFGNEMQKIKRSAEVAEAGVERAMDKAARATAKGAYQSRQLGLQIGQIGSQLAVGTSPFIIMAQQASDLVIALDGVPGPLSRIIRFFGSWQGALVLAALTIGATMIPELLKLNDELEESIKKLEEDAHKTDINRRAKEEFGKSLIGVKERVRDLREELQKLNELQSLPAEKAFEQAKSLAEDGATAIEDGIKRLEATRDRLVAALVAGTGGNSGRRANANEVIRLNEQITRTNELIVKARANLEKLRQNVAVAESFVVVEQALLTEEEKVNREYAKRIDAARQLALANGTVKTELDKQVRALEAARDAEIERLRTTKKINGEMTRFIDPVSGGRISGRFGEQRAGRRHAGTDIAVPVGTPVKAAAGGTVIESGRLGNFGNVVIIDHGNGTITRYAHLSQLGVTKGQAVGQGDQIGLSGGARGAPGAGNSQGPHLHFEVRLNGKAVDPASGPFPTDALGEAADIFEIERKAAEAELKRRQAFENELADLLGNELDARQALITAAEEIAALEYAAIEISRAKYNDNLASLVEQKKLTAEEAQQLEEINNERARLRAELVKRREDERKFRLREAELRNQAQFAGEERRIEAELLQGQGDLVRTQAERREIERRLIELQYQEERARNDYLIGYYERLKLQENVTESELKEAEAAAQIAELRNASLEQRQANATARSDQQTQSPIASFLDTIPSTAAEIDEALEAIAAGGLASVVDGLTDAIVNFRSLGDVGRAVLQSLTASLVKLALQQLILKVVGQTAGNAVVGATGAQAAATASAWAPAAALASLATLGSNAGPAAIALGTTNALAAALALSGSVARAGGGPIFGPGGPTEDRVIVRASPGEYMIRASSARKLGRAALDAMNLTGELPGAFALGGPVFGGVTNATAARGGGSGGGMATLAPEAVAQLSGIVQAAIKAMPPVNLYPTLEPATAFRAALASPGGARAMFDFITDNSRKFNSALQQ